MTAVHDVDLALLRRRSVTPRPAPAGHRDAPLTFGQQTLWRSEHGTPAAGVSHFVLLFRWRGRGDPAALDRAVSALHERHPALRTTFAESPTGVRQHVRPPLPVTVPWRQVPDPPAGWLALCALAEALGGAAYRLAERPPVRWLGVRLGDDEHVLVCAMHHLVADAASVAVLRSDLATLYAGSATPPPSGHVTDVAVAQHSGPVDAEVAVWLDRLRGAPPTVPLPFDREPTGSSTYRGATLDAPLPGLDPLAGLARTEGTGLLAAVTALYALLLGRRAGRDDVLVGTVLSARTRPELDGVVGYLAQPLPLRLAVPGRVSPRELVRRTGAVVLAAMEHQDVPFERIWRELGVPVVPGRPPLVQTMCQVAEAEDPTDHPTVTQLPTPVSAVDLSVTVTPGPVPSCSWEYRTDLFDRTTIHQLHQDFRTLIATATAAPDHPLTTP
jgi:condensation domain-containing protein